MVGMKTDTTGLSKMSDQTGSVFQDSDFLAFFGAEDGISTGIDLCNNTVYQSSCDERWSQFAVYRVMFALTVFHLALGVLTLGVKRSTDCRSGLQNGCWLLKFVVLIGVMVAAFFIKNIVFAGAWSYVATVGACFFLLAQSFGVSIMAHSWNESIKGQLEDTSTAGTASAKAFFWLLFFTGANIALTVIIFKYFTCEHDKTATNLATSNLIFGLVLYALGIYGGLRSARRREERMDEIPRVGLLQPAIVTFFMTYQIWSAVSETNQLCQIADTASAEATNFSLNSTRPEPNMRANDITTTFLGMVWVLVTVAFISRVSAPSQRDVDVIAAAEDGTGSGSNDGKGQRVVDDETDEVTYSWWQFHFILACGALYVSCLITNWGRVNDDTPTVVDDDAVAAALATSAFEANRNKAPVWIKSAFAWLTGIFYLVWTIPPLINPDHTGYTAEVKRRTSDV